MAGGHVGIRRGVLRAYLDSVRLKVGIVGQQGFHHRIWKGSSVLGKRSFPGYISCVTGRLKLFSKHLAIVEKRASKILVSRHLVIDVEDALLNLVVDLPRSVDEGLLDVGRRLGRRLHEDEAVLAREGLALFPLDVAARLQITWDRANW